MSFRPTPVAWAELGGAVVLTTLATVLGIGGARSTLRESAAAEAAHGYFRTAEPGTGGLEAVNLAIDRAPEDRSLLLVKATMLAARKGERERAEALFLEVSRGKSSADEGERRAAALAACGWAAVQLGRLRDPDDPGAEGARDLLRSSRLSEMLDAARRLAPRRLEPHAYLAAVLLENGDVKGARASAAAAEEATEPPTQGGLLTLLAVNAELARRDAAYGLEAAYVARAIALAPSLAGPAKAGAPRRPDLRERLVRALARRAVDPQLTGEAAKAAIEAVKLALLPVHPLERYRKAPLYGLERERTMLVKEAIAVAEARAGNLEGARRTLEESLKEAPGEPGLLRQLAGVASAAALAERNDAARKGLARKASDAISEAVERGKITGKEGYELCLAAAVHARDADLLEQSMRLLERAAKCSAGAESDPRFIRCTAVVLDQWGKLVGAIEAYRKLLARAPGDAAAPAIEARIAILEARRR